MKTQNKYNLDLIDMEIIKRLRHNGRKPYRQIAQELKVAVGTITNRIEKLEKQGIIRGFEVRLDYRQLGYTIESIIKIEHKSSIEHIVYTYPENIETSYKTTGKYNTILITRFKDVSELKQFLEMLQKETNIHNTTTELILNADSDYNKFKNTTFVNIK